MNFHRCSVFKHLKICCMLFVFLGIAFGQGSDLDVVTLKNGSVLKGIITEQDSDKNVTIILPGGVSVALKGENVMNIGKDGDNNNSALQSVALKGENAERIGKDGAQAENSLMEEMLKREARHSSGKVDEELYDKIIEFFELNFNRPGESIRSRDKEKGKIIAGGHFTIEAAGLWSSVDVLCYYSMLVTVKDGEYTVDFPTPNYSYAKSNKAAGIDKGDPIEPNENLRKEALRQLYKIEADLDRYVYGY